MDWGRRARLTTVAVVVAVTVSCAGERIESAIDAPLPGYVEACEDQYEEGEIIEYSTEGTFSKACVHNGDLVTPVPVSLDCSDGPDLVYNDFAWGYEGQEMTVFPADEIDRRPDEDERLACLRRDMASPGGDEGDEAAGG